LFVETIIGSKKTELIRACKKIIITATECGLIAKLNLRG
jgi:hypothetical protein